MVAIYILLMLISLFFGVHALFIANAPVEAVHMLILCMYFFVTIYEFYGKPFRLPIYYLLVFLLITDTLFQLFIITNIFGLISLLFAFSAWQSLKRLRG
ncbi:hypothetical protein [Thermoflavimicrobium daqui]|uniref:Uncharacterized protein n=1 Tax=Thermoflavimicrobium daqui TaxID=2137476 RepID=A0A364K4Z3_9BACL|nr:hypothetical protein [Thermoflavimicrobium daqui]RAL24361.1 hypothetical protein DL897_08520 [Thermoflavimicrobium daqui]